MLCATASPARVKSTTKAAVPISVALFILCSTLMALSPLLSPKQARRRGDADLVLGQPRIGRLRYGQEIRQAGVRDSDPMRTAKVPAPRCWLVRGD